MQTLVPHDVTSMYGIYIYGSNSIQSILRCYTVGGSGLVLYTVSGVDTLCSPEKNLIEPESYLEDAFICRPITNDIFSSLIWRCEGLSVRRLCFIQIPRHGAV